MPFSFASGVITVTGGATSGTVTSAAASSITDTTKSWMTNQWADRHVWIHTGPGAGQIRKIVSSTGTTLTVTPAWTSAITGASQYIVAYNFADVKSANDAGSWGVVARNGNQFQLSARIFIGDGIAANRGFFGDVNKSISWSASSVPAYTNFWSTSHICMKDHSAVAFGSVLNEANKTSTDGCSFLTEATAGVVWFISRCTISGGVPASNNATVFVNSCKFHQSVPTIRAIVYTLSLTGESMFRNCEFDRAEFNPGQADSYNITAQGARYGFGRVLGGCERVTVVGVTNEAAYTHPTGESSAVFRNLKTRNCGTWFGFLGNVTMDCFMVNPDADVKNISSQGGGGTARLWEQYEFDLTVRRASDSAAISGARVRFSDSTGAEVLNTTTNASGLIATQTLNRGFYTGAGGSTITARTPHDMRIRRYGFIPLQLSINATVKQAFNDFRAADAFVVASEAMAGAYTGVALDGVAKTITLSGARTVQELYDYVQWWQVQSGNIQYDVSLTTVDGVNYLVATGWTLIGAANLTFGARRISGALRFTTARTYTPNLGTATLTFTTAGTYDCRSASITGTVTLVNTSSGAVTVQLQPGVAFTNTGPNITVDNAVSATFTVSNIVAGSRLLIRRTDTQAVLVNESVAGTSRAYTYTYTADIPVEIVVRKATGSPTYQQWRTTATLTASGGSVTAGQQLDE